VQATLRRAALPVTAAALALLVTAPLLGRGLTLSYDMVFAPRQYLGPDALGTGSALPRSVPADAVVALVTTVIPGDILQQLALTGSIFFAALGAGRLVPTGSILTRLVAATGYAWSAYLAERLFIGHWPLLIAYACLPWIAMAARDLRDGEPKAGARLILTCAPAALTPPGGLLAAGIALVVAGPRKAWLAAAVSIVLNAPWWLPSILHPGGTLTETAGVGAFSARAENWGGAVLSVLGTGGIWNADVAPESRAGALVPVLTVVVVALALYGLRAQHWARGLTLLGAFGVLVASFATLPGGANALSWAMRTIPGAGMLRDSQKWVAWWALPMAIGFALAVELVGKRLRSTSARRSLLVAGVLVPVLAMPDLALAGWGRLTAVHYPADWLVVRDHLDGDPRHGDVLVLPFQTFRQFGWNGDRTQLDPAPRVLSRTVVADDSLPVNGVVVPGEDQRAAAARQLVERGGDLRMGLQALGIGWILVEHGTPGPPAPATSWFVPEFDGQWLTLYRVPDPIEPNPIKGAPTAPVVAADIIALLLLAYGLLWRLLPPGRLTGRRP
jgi:hypothetical protein